MHCPGGQGAHPVRRELVGRARPAPRHRRTGFRLRHARRDEDRWRHWLASGCASGGDTRYSSLEPPLARISLQLLSVTATAHWVEYADWWNAVMSNPLQIESGMAIPQDAPGQRRGMERRRNQPLPVLGLADSRGQPETKITALPVRSVVDAIRRTQVPSPIVEGTATEHVHLTTLEPLRRRPLEHIPD